MSANQEDARQPQGGSAFAAEKASSSSNDEDELDLDDKMDLFCDFLETDEWILPIKSFIECYCLVFATEDPQEFLE